MAFVQFAKVSLAFGDRDILREVSLNLASGSKAALTGANGAGKTTLMKVISGLMPADSGERAVQKGTRVSYLPQSGIVHRGRTLKEETETAFAPIARKLKCMEELGRELETSASNDSGRTAALLEEHHRLGEEVENSGYYRREAAVSSVLKGLGFKSGDEDRNVEEFSGGWQMRIALAKILLENSDILLLDEPTNYLDIEARNWLEGWLQNCTGGYLLVSHDRWFLDVTVNDVYELFQGNLKRYAGNYTAYEKTAKMEIESLLKRYDAQQEEIKKTEALIERFRYKASKAAFAQELIKRLDKMERIEIPESLKKMSITLPQPPHSGRIAFTLEGITKSYGSNRVLSGLDLSLDAGEKLLVAGMNGAGKTTLLRIIAGEDSNFEGSINYGAGIIPGYFSQDAAETISGNITVLEYLEAESPTYLIPKLRDMLGAFLFRGDDVYKSLSVLSGGEKSRLCLLRMLLKPLNLLILDEPTNHLDLHSKDILLDCLSAYTGTVVFVSHDRAFMEALSTKTLGLKRNPESEEGPKPQASTADRRSAHCLYYGGYAYYLERMEADKAEENLSSAFAVTPKTALPVPDDRSEKKQRQTLVRRLRREEEAILAELEKLEAEKTKLETDLGKPEIYSSTERARETKRKLDEIETAVKEKTAAWEDKAAELESIRS